MVHGHSQMCRSSRAHFFDSAFNPSLLSALETYMTYFYNNSVLLAHLKERQKWSIFGI
jgi:hypothetical protein